MVVDNGHASPLNALQISWEWQNTLSPQSNPANAHAFRSYNRFAEQGCNVQLCPAAYENSCAEQEQSSDFASSGWSGTTNCRAYYDIVLIEHLAVQVHAIALAQRNIYKHNFRDIL
ncbi:TPA: hypothetical protein ACH3X2_001739 [Trebouxia sp. C0005]